MIPGHEYIFSYMTNKNSLTFDGVNVLVKQGPFRKTTFAFGSINNWYVFDEKTYRALIITYTNEAGKSKKVQLYAQLGEPGFRDTVEALNAAIPNKSLNHLPQKEAFKVMKTANPKKVAAIGAMVVILVLTTSFMYPALRHYFDFGFADADVEQLINGDDFGTRNLNLYGIPLEQTLESTTTKNGSTQSVEYFVPIVGSDWDENDPIEVVLKFDKMNEDEFEELYDNVEFKGLVRNIGYEGIADDEKEFFVTEYGFTMSDDVILFEVTGEEHNDALMFFVWVALNGIFVIIFGIVYLKNR